MFLITCDRCGRQIGDTIHEVHRQHLCNKCYNKFMGYTQEIKEKNKGEDK